MRTVVREGRNAIRNMQAEVALSFEKGFTSEVARHVLMHRGVEIKAPVLDTARFADKPAPPTDYAAVNLVLSLLKRQASAINQLGGALADQGSRDIIKALLAYRAWGPTRVELPNAGQFRSKIDAARRVRNGAAESSFPPLEMGRYEPMGDDGKRITVDCWEVNTIYTFIERQYFFERDGVSIRPLKGDVVIDAGACFGDTALLFASVVGDEGRIHSFEPLERQREVFQRNVKRNPHLAPRISVYPWALDTTSDRVVTFTDGGAGARVSSDGTVKAKTVSIDDFVQRQQLQAVDFIKMDIEGGETSALRGAAETIRRFRPRLAISIYHSLSDLVNLPLLVRELAPSYELFIDHHTIHVDETILYGRPRQTFPH